MTIRSGWGSAMSYRMKRCGRYREHCAGIFEPEENGESREGQAGDDIIGNPSRQAVYGIIFGECKGDCKKSRLSWTVRFIRALLSWRICRRPSFHRLEAR
jgi:hypothetical protein